MSSYVLLTEDEKSVLQLHPKFSLRDTVTIENLEYEQELGYAKVRMELRKENEESLEDEDTLVKSGDTPSFVDQNEILEKERIDELSAEQEARSRQFYDPEENVYDYRKKRVTDIRENARVTLPRPVLEIQEAGIALRRDSFNNITNKYIEEHCNEKNEQEPNLTKGESRGLKSLQRRIKEGEIVIIN